MVRLEVERVPLPAIALTTDTSLLTAAGNDYGFETIFARQVGRKLGRPGDVLLAISTSGNSPNVVRAVEEAHSSQLIRWGYSAKMVEDLRRWYIWRWWSPHPTRSASRRYISP